MGRVAQQKPAKQGPGPSTGAAKAAKVSKQRKKHKLVFESTSNKDDEDSGVVLSFHTDPPPGYTFIPAGNTQLTAAMKLFAKRNGQKIMAVSATPHATRHELSREVHRVGYHFPTQIVDQVCSHYGIRLDSSGRLIGENDSEKLFMKISQKGQVVLNEKIRDQVTINTEAKEIIRDLFPKIPDNDLFQIIKTAFQLGDNKVGTADEIPLVRRAQLSVVAHIRHNYTNYDKLLRQVPYNEARHMVEKPTLKRLVEWRGDDKAHDDNGKRAVDEAVREVVVLSDEDESESELEEGQVVEGRGDAMEVDSVKKPAPRIIATQHRSVSPGELSSEEEPRGYRYVSQPARQRVVVPAQSSAQARQQTRYAVWDQARQEYWARPSATVVSRIPQNDPYLARTGRNIQYLPARPARIVVQEPQPVRVIRERSPPTIFRAPDGRLFEKVSNTTNGTYSPHRVYTPPTRNAIPNYTSLPRRSASPRIDRPHYHQRTPSMNDDGTVVQSIEYVDGMHLPPAIRHGPSDPNLYQSQNERSGPSRYAPKHIPLIDLTESAEQATKRMRPSTPPSPWLTRSRHDQFQTDNGINANNQRVLIDLSPRVPIDEPRPQRSFDNRVVYVEPDDPHYRNQQAATHYYEDNLASLRHRPMQADHALRESHLTANPYLIQDPRMRHDPANRHELDSQMEPSARYPRGLEHDYANPFDYNARVSTTYPDGSTHSRMDVDYEPPLHYPQYTTQTRSHAMYPSSSRQAYVRQ